MPKYIMLYKLKERVDLSLLPKEELIKVKDQWGEWLGKVGPAVSSPGDAFKFGGKVIDSHGTQDADNLTSGFSVIEAKDFDEALGFASSNPIVAQGGQVEVYEAMGTQE